MINKDAEAAKLRTESDRMSKEFHTHTHTHTYIYIYTHTHIYIYTYTHTLQVSELEQAVINKDAEAAKLRTESDRMSKEFADARGKLMMDESRFKNIVVDLKAANQVCECVCVYIYIYMCVCVCVYIYCRL